MITKKRVKFSTLIHQNILPWNKKVYFACLNREVKYLPVRLPNIMLLIASQAHSTNIFASSL